MDTVSFTGVSLIENLVAAGLPKSSADCYIARRMSAFEEFIFFDTKPTHYDMDWTYYPCWSLGKLLSMLPFTIRVPEKGNKAFYLHFDFSGNGEGTLMYVAEDNEMYCMFSGTMISCVAEFLIFLLRKRLIKGELGR